MEERKKRKARGLGELMPDEITNIASWDTKWVGAVKWRNREARDPADRYGRYVIYTMCALLFLGAVVAAII